LTDLERVARFYGLTEKELVRKHGGLLETNLQAFEDAMRDSIIKKVVSEPENWTEQAQEMAAISSLSKPAASRLDKREQ
jgi:hypothetical protein